MTGDDFQIVYQDTPGVLTPAYMLHVSLDFFFLGAEAIGDVKVIVLPIRFVFLFYLKY